MLPLGLHLVTVYAFNLFGAVTLNVNFTVDEPIVDPRSTVSAIETVSHWLCCVHAYYTTLWRVKIAPDCKIMSHCDNFWHKDAQANFTSLRLKNLHFVYCFQHFMHICDARHYLTLRNVHYWKRDRERERERWKARYNDTRSVVLNAAVKVAVSCRGLGRGVDSRVWVWVVRSHSVVQGGIWCIFCHRTLLVQEKSSLYRHK